MTYEEASRDDLHDRCDEALAKHEIAILYDTGDGLLGSAPPRQPKVRHVGFKLSRPDTGAFAFEVHFTGFGVFIQGDLSPVHPGGFGSRQYKTLGWFIGDLSPGYLAQKFLDEGYRPKLAADELEGLMEEHEDWGIPEDSLPDLKGIVEELRDGGGDLVSDSRLYDRMTDAGLGHLCDDGVPGWVHDPDEVKWLVAIQKCFCREYAKLQGRKENP